MKLLTEVKDGQKVLVAFDVKIYEDDLESPIHLEIDGNSAGFNLSLDLYDDVTGQKNTLYDFNEVMNAKKSEPISKEEFEKKVWDSWTQKKLINFDVYKNYLYDIFTYFHPESFTPEVGKEYEFSDDRKKWFVRKYGGYASIDESYEGTRFEGWKFIRPIQPSEEELKAIELLKNLGYTKIEK